MFLQTGNYSFCREHVPVESPLIDPPKYPCGVWLCSASESRGYFQQKCSRKLFLRDWNPTITFPESRCLSLFSINITEVNTQKGQRKVCIFYQHDFMTLRTTVLWQWRPPDPGAAVAGLWTPRCPMHQRDWCMGMGMGMHPWGWPVEPFFTCPPLTIVSLNFTSCFAYFSFEYMAHLLFGDLNW